MPLLSPRLSRTSSASGVNPESPAEPKRSNSNLGKPKSLLPTNSKEKLTSFLSRSPSSSESPSARQNSSDSLELLAKAESAATVVQARMRGNQARKQQQEDAAASKAKAKDAEASKAITTVQARLRGRMSRKSLQTAHKAELKAKHEAKAKPAAAGPKAMDDDRAATVMQSGIRGYFARRSTSREAEAATVVQARMRGKSARDALAEGSFKAGGKGSSKQKSFSKSRSRRNPFEGIMRTKARVAQSMSDRVVNARMKMTMKASRMLLTGWIDGAAEVDMWSTPEEIAAGKEMWMNLLNWVFARMKAKELEVKGIGSARLRAVIQRDEEPEAWPGPPPIFIALDEEHTVLDVVLQPLRWLRAKALYALLPADKDIWSSHRTEPSLAPALPLT